MFVPEIGSTNCPRKCFRQRCGVLRNLHFNKFSCLQIHIAVGDADAVFYFFAGPLAHTASRSILLCVEKPRQQPLSSCLGLFCSVHLPFKLDSAASTKHAYSFVSPLVLF